MKFHISPQILLAMSLIPGLLFAGCLEGGYNEPRSGSGQVSLNLQTHQNGDYRINGTVEVELAIENEIEFNAVMACVYDEQGQLLTSDNLGTFKTPRDTARLSVRTDIQPTYIIVDHPEFREYDSIAAAIFHWRDDRIRDTTGNPEEYIQAFEYIAPTQPGECGQTSP
jgi:hypothetical protein